MSSPPDEHTGGSHGSSRINRPGAQGASRGGVRPEGTPDARPDEAPDQGGGRHSSYDPNAAYDRPRPGGNPGAPFGGYPFRGHQTSDRGSGGWWSKIGGDTRFLGLPVGLIYGIGAALIALVFIGAVCGAPTKTGSVAGQVMQMGADRTVSALPGAQLTLRGGGNTYTAASTDVPPGAEGEAAYNYRFENVPPGTYALEVKPPAGASLQPEEGLTLEVESGQLFPQSVMLLAEGVQKPRQLAQNELQPGEAGGYVDDKGQRHTYQQGGGFDAGDALLMYLLWRNPPGWGYGAPPVIVNSPGSSSYRVSNPPTQTRTGQTVTQQRPSTPGQGSVRPSSGSGATGSAPSRSAGSNPDAVAPSTGSGGSSGSSTGSGGNTQTQPSTGAGSSTTTKPSAPSQGSTRPSSSSSSPSRSTAPSRSSGSSGGGRR